MRKYLLTTIFIFYSFSLIMAQQDTIRATTDTLKKHPLKNFNFSFIWFEAGNTFAFKEKNMLDLPYGMDKFFYNVKGGFSTNFFGLGAYYKDKFGIAFVFQMMDVHVNGNEFKDYITLKYPGYYIPDYVPTYGYELGFIQYRICYKFHIKRFVIEPHLQFGINDYSSFQSNFTLKDIGSNFFTEYWIDKKNLKKNDQSFQLAVNCCKRFGKKNGERLGADIGLRFAYGIAPTDYEYTITETPYLMTPTINKLEVKHLHQSFTIDVLVHLLF